MDEIRARAEKHIEVVEDRANRLEVERQPRVANHTQPPLKGENKYPAKLKDYPLALTPLRKKKTQILCKIYHTNLLKYPKEAKGRETQEGPRREEKQRETSRSPQRRDTRHRGVIRTIFRGGSGAGGKRSRKRKINNILVIREKANTTPTPVIAFGKKDMWSEPPRHDEPMVISIVVAEYKVGRVLIDQGSSANILYWSMYKKLGLKLADMKPYMWKLYGFASD
ncbi:hypothetical protein CR513_62566, partial [Mucuna pruriens]